LTTVENNYATKATPVAGTYNNVTVNGQGIVTTGSNVDYALTSTVASISGGLNTRLTTVEGNYATKATPVAGTYNNVTVNGQGIVTTGSNVDYALTSTVASISGNLQTQINTKQPHITLVAGSNISIVESPTDTWTISATSVISGGGGGSSPAVTIVSTNTTLTNTQNIVEQTASGITTTLWSSPANTDYVKIRNNTTSGYNTINGNGALIEDASTFTMYAAEAFEFRYDGTKWVAF
jgi:hypothetical protein